MTATLTFLANVWAWWGALAGLCVLALLWLYVLAGIAAIGRAIGDWWRLRRP